MSCLKIGYSSRPIAQQPISNYQAACLSRGSKDIKVMDLPRAALLIWRIRSVSLEKGLGFRVSTYLWSAGNEGMEKPMETTIMGS